MVLLYVFVGIIIILIIINYYMFKKLKKSYITIEKLNEDIVKQTYTIRLFYIWLKEKSNRKEIGDYFTERGWNNVIIYGMSDLGRSLKNELLNNDINVIYAIDKNESITFDDLMIYHTIPENRDDKNVVIVTVISLYDVIKKELNANGYTNIVCLDEIIMNMISSDPKMMVI